MGVPQNAWFVMDNPPKMADLEVPSFMETPCMVVSMRDISKMDRF